MVGRVKLAMDRKETIKMSNEAVIWQHYDDYRKWVGVLSLRYLNRAIAVYKRE